MPKSNKVKEIKTICDPCQRHVHRMCKGGDCDCPMNQPESVYIDWETVGPALLSACEKAMQYINSSSPDSYDGARSRKEAMEVLEQAIKQAKGD